MPKLIPQTIFFGTPSVIYAQINSPKQFFPACIGSVDNGILLNLGTFNRINSGAKYLSHCPIIQLGVGIFDTKLCEGIAPGN